jgi:hypothetical protein
MPQWHTTSFFLSFSAGVQTVKLGSRGGKPTFYIALQKCLNHLAGRSRQRNKNSNMHAAGYPVLSIG